MTGIFAKICVVCIRAKWPIRPELIPVSLAWSDQEYFYSPPMARWDAGPSQGYPPADPESGALTIRAKKIMYTYRYIKRVIYEYVDHEWVPKHYTYNCNKFAYLAYVLVFELHLKTGLILWLFLINYLLWLMFRKGNPALTKHLKIKFLRYISFCITKHNARYGW